MAKLNAPNLLGRLKEVREDGGLSGSMSSVLSSEGASDDNGIIDGRIDPEVSTLIASKIEKLVESFKAEKDFNWRVHILDPIQTIVEVTKLIGDFGDRQGMEVLVVELLKDLYGEYRPNIPWVPDFLAKWLMGMAIDKLAPWVVDWVLDFIYGEDEEN